MGAAPSKQRSRVKNRQLWKRLTTLNKSHSTYVGSNLTLNQQSICNDISNRQTQLFWLSDKNMVPVWWETELYTKWGVLDHIGNKTTHKQLKENIVKSRIVELKYSHESFITRNRLELSDAEQIYLWQSLKQCDKKVSRFYLTEKLTRPWG